MEFNRQTKMAAREAMKAKEQAMAERIDQVMKTGDPDADLQQRGCTPGCFSFFRRGRSRLAQEQIEGAVFGQNGASNSTANANVRLGKAAEQMESHASQLYAKSGASRSKAKALMAQGKKQEAMLALRRCKTLEKQAETAMQTHAAIEQQQDMLQSSALQRDVASALSSAVKSTKVKTKGLLEKAEDAVDSSAELKDAFEDISEVLGGLNKHDFDEDELMAEIEAMSQPEPAAESEVVPAKAQVEPQAIVVGIDPQLYPKAPRAKKEQKQKLLAHDSAAEAAVS